MASSHPTGEASSGNTWSFESFADLIALRVQFATPKVKPASLYNGEATVFFDVNKIASLASPFSLCLLGKLSYVNKIVIPSVSIN